MEQREALRLREWFIWFYEASKLSSLNSSICLEMKYVTEVFLVVEIFLHLYFMDLKFNTSETEQNHFILYNV